MTRRTALMATLALAMLALALLPGSGAHAATTLPRAPDFTLTLLDGKPLSLADLNGKPVLINFWRGG